MQNCHSCIIMVINSENAINCARLAHLLKGNPLRPLVRGPQRLQLLYAYSALDHFCCLALERPIRVLVGIAW